METDTLTRSTEMQPQTVYNLRAILLQYISENELLLLPDTIYQICLDRYGAKPKDRCKEREIVQLRQVATWWSFHIIPSLGFKVIGKQIGNKDRITAYHSHNVINDLLATRTPEIVRLVAETGKAIFTHAKQLNEQLNKKTA